MDLQELALINPQIWLCAGTERCRRFLRRRRRRSIRDLRQPFCVATVHQSNCLAWNVSKSLPLYCGVFLKELAGLLEGRQHRLNHLLMHAADSCTGTLARRSTPTGQSLIIARHRRLHCYLYNNPELFFVPLLRAVFVDYRASSCASL